MSPKDSNKNGAESRADGSVENTEAFWRKDWLNVQGSLLSLRRSSSFPSSPLRVMRVSQLDAELLDSELFETFKEQLWLLFSPQVRQTFEPELLAILQFMSRFTIYDSGASYGAQLQNLKYRNERHHWGGLQSTAKDSPLTRFQKVTHAALTVGGQYMWMRANRLMTSQGWGELGEDEPRKIFWKVLQKVENIYKTLSLLNFLIFLRDGKYSTLIDRILSMRLVYARREMSRQVSFEFLNRQLIWHAFTEFILFLMPLINLRKFKNLLKRNLLPESYSKTHTLDFLPTHICAICHENQSASSASMSSGVISSKINNPYETNCGHKYCYFCIKVKLIQEGGTWQCLRCGAEVKEIKRFLEKLIDEEEENDETHKNKGKQPVRGRY